MSSSGVTRAAAALRAFALRLPEAHEDFPWGERVVKVRKKVFVFLGRDDAAELAFSVKLPLTGPDVLELPFARPTGYGLGKSGWVSLRFGGDELPGDDLLRGWILESYRAVAPKRAVKQLAASPADAPRASAPGATMRRMTGANHKKLTVYGYMKCGTCRKALAWLDEREVPYRFVDITEKPPSKATLKKALGQGYELKHLYNTSGKAYREGKVGERRKSLSDAQQLELLAGNGRLIKRPIISDGARFTVGFDADRFAATWES